MHEILSSRFKRHGYLHMWKGFLSLRAEACSGGSRWATVWLASCAVLRPKPAPLLSWIPSLCLCMILKALILLISIVQSPLQFNARGDKFCWRGTPSRAMRCRHYSDRQPVVLQKGSTKCRFVRSQPTVHINSV